MKKLSLRLRLTILTSLLLLACCLIMYLFMMNSAILQLDSIEAGMITIQSTEDESVMLSLKLQDVYPEISTFIADAKAVFFKQSLLMAIGLIAFGSLMTFLLSKFALQPVHSLSQKIEETTEENLYEPLEVPESRDEIAKLTLSFNKMRERINAAFLSQKQFSANAAHELRTPLAVMQTSLEVFQKKEEKTEADYQDAMDTTLRQVERMNHLVDTLLEFQSMHTAELKDQVMLPELIEEILCDLDGIAEEKGISLEFDMVASDEDVPDIASSDMLAKQNQGKLIGNEVLLYRGIFNLVENAIKYNREGGKVRVSATDYGKATNQYIVRVEDTGSGIDPSQWESIFDAFYRVDKSRSRRLGGAGLGLAMVKEIADLHKGQVYVEKSDENGTTMCFVVPE